MADEIKRINRLIPPAMTYIPPEGSISSDYEDARLNLIHKIRELDRHLEKAVAFKKHPKVHRHLRMKLDEYYHILEVIEIVLEALEAEYATGQPEEIRIELEPEAESEPEEFEG